MKSNRGQDGFGTPVQTRRITTWPGQGWRCVRMIGEGSFGRVYEIARTEFGQEYRAALKVIGVPQSGADLQEMRRDGLDEQSVTAHFREIVEDIVREIALMNRMKGHSNIVSYEDHLVLPREGALGWDILIRMELLTPLHDYVGSRTLEEEEVIRLGCDICRALELCQRKHIIHRDIKPENILVNEFGDFKLGDIGIARTVECAMSKLPRKRNDTYTAPEVCRGDHYDQTVDIYSLGVVLYRYLNENRIPFLPRGVLEYRDLEEAQRRRMAGEMVPAPRRCSQTLQCVVLKALAFDPRERYQTAADFREALEGCLDGVPKTPPEPARQETPPEPARQELEDTVNVRQSDRPEPEKKSEPRKKPLWAFALAAVLVVVLAIVLFPREDISVPPEDPFEAWPELSEVDVLEKYVAGAIEDGFEVVSVKLDGDGGVETISFDGDSDKTARVEYRTRSLIGRIIEYTASGNPLKEIYYYTDGTISNWYTYEYDASGNRIKQTLFYRDGTIDWYSAYEYNASGELIKTTDYDDDIITGWYIYEYDEAGKLQKMTFHNADGTTGYWDIYERDASGNTTTKTRYTGSGTIDFWYTYEYDASGKLTRETRYFGDGSIQYISEYDASGNLSKKTEYNADGTIAEVIEY